MANINLPTFQSVPSLGELLQDSIHTQSEIQQNQANTDLLKIKTLIGGEEIKSIIDQRASNTAWSQYMAQRNALAPAVDSSGTLLSPKQASDQEMSPLRANAMTLIKRRDEVKRDLDFALSDPRLGEQQKTLRMIYDNLSTQSREALNEATKQDEKDADRFTNLVSGVQSGQDIQETYDWVAQNMGPRKAAFFASQFPRDQDGQFVYNDAAQRAAMRFQNMGMTVTQRLANANNEAMRADAKARIAETTAHNLDLKDSRDAATVIARDKANAYIEDVDSKVKTRARRLELATTKAERVRQDPSSPEAKMTARYLVAQLEMPQDLAGKAAYDFLRTKADLLKSGAEPDDADAEALADVTAKFTKGEKGKKSWIPFVADEPSKPARYGGGREASGTIKTAPSGGTTTQFKEGDTATNPQTKAKVIFRNGKWEPVT